MIINLFIPLLKVCEKQRWDLELPHLLRTSSGISVLALVWFEGLSVCDYVSVLLCVCVCLRVCVCVICVSSCCVCICVNMCMCVCVSACVCVACFNISMYVLACSKMSMYVLACSNIVIQPDPPWISLLCQVKQD